MDLLHAPAAEPLPLIAFEQILSEDQDIYAEKCMLIPERILRVLGELNLRQKDLADRMGKSEAELSKLLSGFHNYTIKTISKIEAALGKEVLSVVGRENFHYRTELKNVNPCQSSFRFIHFNASDLNVQLSKRPAHFTPVVNMNSTKKTSIAK
jgi:transcriptional regulator with XRE-family HTH domain